MKNILFTLCLLSGTSLIADYTRRGVENPPLNNGNTSSRTCQSSSCSCGCKSCCIPPPKPKKTIDCECYTPAYYDLDCDWGLFVSVDFLYWFAKDSSLKYAVTTNSDIISAQGENILSINPIKYKSLEQSWDPGVRVGLGFNSSDDGWDLYATWTYFHTKKRSSVSVPSFNSTDIDFGMGGSNLPFTQAIISPWVYPATILGALEVGATLPYFNYVSAQWILNYNMIDLELGRKYWLSPCFTIRPYAGLRGGWTRNSFTTTGELDTVSLNPTGNGGAVHTFEIHQNTFINQFWGVGLIGGFQPNWYMGCGFSLFGNAEIALLWGNYKASRKGSLTAQFATSTQPSSFSFSPSHSIFSDMQGMLDLEIGVSWESTFCYNRYRLTIDLGWEHHLLFDHTEREKLLGAFFAGVINLPPTGVGYSFQNFDEVYGNLSLAGLTVRARFDF